MARPTEDIIFSGVYPGCDSDESEYQYSNSLTSVSISNNDVVTVNNQISYDYCNLGASFFDDVLNNQTVINAINYCITNQQNSYISSVSISTDYAQILYNVCVLMNNPLKIVPLKLGSFIVSPNVIVAEPDNGYLYLEIVMTDTPSDNVIRKTFNIAVHRSGGSYSGTCTGTVEYICDIPIT